MPREEKKGKLGWKLIRRLNGKQDYKMDRAPYPVQSIGPPLLQFPVPNHAPQQHTIQQNTIPSIWKLVFVLAMGCCCWGWKPFGKKMQKKCFLSLLGWDAMLSCFLNKRKHKLSKKKQIWVALSVWTICFICCENVIFKCQKKNAKLLLNASCCCFSNFYWHGKEKSLL